MKTLPKGTEVDALGQLVQGVFVEERVDFPEDALSDEDEDEDEDE